MSDQREINDQRPHLTVLRPDGEAREVLQVDAGDAALEAVFSAVRRAAEKDDAEATVQFAHAAAMLLGPGVPGMNL